jgi:vacuolar protein 8
MADSVVLSEVLGHLQDAETDLAAVKTMRLLLSKDQANRDPTRIALVEGGAVPPFVALLRDGDDVKRQHAAEALCEMTIGSTAAKDACIQAGALHPLVALLRDGSAQTKSNACGAIMNILCRHNDDVTNSIVALGAIPQIVAMIEDGSGDGAMAAAGALRNLTSIEKLRVEAVKAGCIPPLVAVLGAGSAQAKSNAATALRNISCFGEHRICMAKAGAIPPLVACLSDGPSDVATHATVALVNLAFESEERRVAIAKAGGVTPLVALERDGDAESKQMATIALKNLTTNNVDNETAVAAARAAAEIAAHKAKTLALEQRIVDLERELEERTARDDRLRLSRHELQARIGELSRVLNRPNAHGVLARAEAGAALSDLRDEAAELKATLADATSCVVCFGAPRSVVLLPCTHACLCPACAAKLEACPACRAPIAGRSEFILL